MALYNVDLSTSQLYVFTFKAGLLSAMGHDLRLLVPTYSCTLEPQEDSGLSLTVTVETRAIEVDGSVELQNGRPHVSPVAEWAAREIVKNMQSSSVLDMATHPTITYRGILQPREGDQVRIVGDLELRGVRKPLTLSSRVVDDADGAGYRLVGEVEILQSTWGIIPFYAMLGTLKLKDDVRIAWNTHVVKTAVP